MTTIFDQFDRQPHIRSDRTALAMRLGLREERWSFDRYRSGVDHAAFDLMTSHGLNRGDRILLQVPNSPKAAVVLHALLRAGLVAVPLDIGSSAQFVEQVEKAVDAAAIIALPGEHTNVNTRKIYLNNVVTEGDKVPHHHPDSNDLAEIVFTSGTTGSPKGVMLTHGNLASNVQSILPIVPKGEDLRLLSILPLSHMFEQTVGLAMPLLLGGTVYYAPGRSSPVIRRAMKRHRITCMVLVPQMLELMMGGIERQARDRGGWLDWERAKRVATHMPLPVRRRLFKAVITELGGHLSFCMSGGAPLQPGLNTAWETIGVRILEGYGATECAPVIASNSMSTRKPGSVGRGLEDIEIRLSEAGEIQVKGPNVFPGYWNDQDATSGAFSEDGWFRTGDLADIDPEGRIFLKGRLKEMIALPSGMNVYPEDVERELRKIDGIDDCAVVGVPDQQGNPSVHAALCSGLDDARVAEAIRLANTALAPHQHITRYSRWPDATLPRTALMKLKRTVILNSIRDGSDTPSPNTPPAQSPLKRLVAEIANRSSSEIAETTDLRLDLGFDSLQFVELAGSLEAEMGVLMEESTLAAISTFGELADTVGNPPAAPKPMPFATWPRGSFAATNRRVVQNALVFPGHRLLTPEFQVEGSQNVEKLSGPCLFIANHISHMDTVAILRALPEKHRKRTAIAAAADYFFGNHLAAPATMLSLNIFPFSRSDNIRESLEHCGDLVDDGWSILIYPEGTRSATGQLQSFKPGIGLLATGLNIPVVPIGVTGGDTVLPKGKRIPSRGNMCVAFGNPMIIDPCEKGDVVTEQLHSAVRDLLQNGARTPPSTDRTEALT